MPDATITSTASTFGTISGVFSADQSTISGTISGIVPGTLTGSVGVPGPAGPAGIGLPAGGTSGQFLQKTSGVDYATDWVTVNLTGLATESWVTAGFYPLSGNPSGFLTAASLSGYATETFVTSQGYITSSALTPYLTKADNLGSLTNFATARDNLGLGSLSTPTFAGVNVPGAGTSVANLGATSLTINQQGSGQFTIQPSQGIVFPNGSIQTTAFTGVPADYITSVSSPLTVTTGNLSIDLSAYLTSATAASTYQTLSGMSSYLTTSAAASTYQTLAGMSDYLAKAGNLAGLANTGTARTNLGLGSLAVVNDAPSDGSQYARKNGAWDVVSAGASYISSVSSPLSVTSGNLTIDLSAYAQLSGATFTGNVFAPTPSPGTDSTRIATTEWVKDFDYAPTNSPHFTGNPKSVTPSTGDDDTSIATTAFVKAQNYITSAALSPYLTSATAASTYFTIASAAGKANLSGATFTNDILVSSSPDTTNIGAGILGMYSSANLYSLTLSTVAGYPQIFFRGPTGDSTQTVAYPGPSGFLLKADNLSGLANTATARTNLGLGTMATETASNYSTTTAANALYYPLSSNPAGYLTSAPVTSVAGRTGAITLANTDISGLGTMATATAADYSTTTVANGLYYPLSSNPSSYLVAADIAGKADLASPTFTGTPSLPTGTIGVTQTAGNNTTALATTAFVQQEVPAASTTVAGKVELATVAESHASTSASLVPTPFGIQFAIAQGMSQRMDFASQTAVSGSGAVTYIAGFREMYTSATLSAGRAAFFLGGQSGTTYTVFGSNGNEIKLDFSKKIWMAGRLSTSINSTYLGDANGTALITLGGYTGFATGNMTSLGIGLRKSGGTSSVIQLIVHNGTTFTSVNTTKTLAIREQTDYMIYSDGAGNVSLYIEGALAASTSAGPTGITADFGGIYREQVEQTASATVRYSMHCYGGYLCLE